MDQLLKFTNFKCFKFMECSRMMQKLVIQSIYQMM